MDRDGTREGFDIELTRTIADAVNVPIIASGGVGTLDHLSEGVQRGGADAVLAASIFHFREHTVAEAKAVMTDAGDHRPPRLTPTSRNPHARSESRSTRSLIGEVRSLERLIGVDISPEACRGVRCGG